MKKIVVLAAIAASAAGGMLVRNHAEAGSAASAYLPAGPARVLDTRAGDKVTAGTVSPVDTGLISASAVAVNITVTDPSGSGYITAWAAGPVPNASVLNINRAGDTESTFAVVPVVGGAFRLYTSTDVHLIVDVMGYFQSGDVDDQGWPWEGPCAAVQPIGLEVTYEQLSPELVRWTVVSDGRVFGYSLRPNGNIYASLDCLERATS